jgi:hypothetical protein
MAELLLYSEFQKTKVLAKKFWMADFRRRQIWNNELDNNIQDCFRDITTPNKKIEIYTFEGQFSLTLLHEAVRYSKNTLLATKILLEKGADPNIRDSNNVSVLKYALVNERCSVETIILLLKHGACPYPQNEFHPAYYAVLYNSRPRNEQIFLAKLLVQYTTVIFFRKGLDFCDEPIIEELINIRNGCELQWSVIEKNLSDILYTYCTGETNILNEQETCALFDAYVQKKYFYFEEILILVIGTCNIHYLLSNATLANTFFAEKLNVDCILQILSQLNGNDILNFFSAYWKRS